MAATAPAVAPRANQGNRRAPQEKPFAATAPTAAASFTRLFVIIFGKGDCAGAGGMAGIGGIGKGSGDFGGCFFITNAPLKNTAP